MSGSRRKQKTLIITDDDDDEESSSVKEEELNPFSFKEFLRSKNLDSDPDPDQDCEETTEQAWGRSWASGGGARSMSLPEEAEEEVTRFDSCLHCDDDEDSRQSYEGDDETSILDPQTRTRTGPSLQQLTRENQQLKKMITELREESLRHQTKASELNVELLQRRQRDQQEALDLENMVQSVETNLRVMTKRALKAEATVAKLRTELKEVQTRLDSVQAENSDLVCSMKQMKENAQTASDKLQETSTLAKDSVRRLLSEAESLRFVSELLRSIDHISSVH